MPRVEFGEKTHFDGGKTDFLELKNKDQKYLVRFLGSAIYDGKHFFKLPDGKWEVKQCPRIMQNEPCEHCEIFFQAKKEMKEMKAEFGEYDSMDVENKAKFKGLDNKAKTYGETTTFYYPVLNRETETVGILKCAPSIRWMLDEEHSNGVHILDFDYIVKRTEVPGKYYTLTRLDSSMIKALTDKEHEEITKAGAWDLDSMVYGKKSTFSLEQEDANEEAEPVDEELVEVPVDIDELLKTLDGELPE